MSNKYLPYLGLLAASFAVGTQGSDLTDGTSANDNIKWGVTGEIGYHNYSNHDALNKGSCLYYGYNVGAEATFGDNKEYTIEWANTVRQEFTGAAINDSQFDFSYKLPIDQEMFFFATTNHIAHEGFSTNADLHAFGVKANLNDFALEAAVYPNQFTETRDGNDDDDLTDTADGTDTDNTYTANGGSVAISWETDNGNVKVGYFDNPLTADTNETYIGAEGTYSHGDWGSVAFKMAQRRDDADNNPTMFGLGYSYEPEGKVSANVNYATYKANFHEAGFGGQVNKTDNRTYGMQDTDWSVKHSTIDAELGYTLSSQANLGLAFVTNNQDAGTTATNWTVKLVLG